MSTLSVTNIKHASSANSNIVLDTNGNATVAGTLSMATPFGMRNRIINGNMYIDQRAAGAITLGSSGLYGVDRWFGTEDTGGTMTMQRSTVAPPGFSASLLLTTGTADASLAATEYCTVGQAIEGTNVADLKWGTAGASTGGTSTSFPIAFPTACWGVIGVNTNQTNPPAPSISYSRTGFTATTFAGTPTISWFAVGY